MTQFLDCRLSAVGGELASSVGVYQGTSQNDYATLALGDLVSSVRGRHVLIATHGFNVDRWDGVACLSNWGSLLQLPQASAFVGLLWPGDSIWAHGLDYAVEAKVADDELVPGEASLEVRLEPAVVLHPVGQGVADDRDVVARLDLDQVGFRRWE